MADDDEVSEKRKTDNGEQTGQKRKRVNAFAELMAPKSVVKAAKTTATTATTTTTTTHGGGRRNDFRNALGIYLRDPAALTGPAATAVLWHNDAFVAVRDRFPKSTVHCLLLPRDPAVHRQHPVALLNRTDEAGSAFRAAVRAEAAKLRCAVAADLREKLGGGSEQEGRRRRALLEEDEEEEEEEADNSDDAALPPGRDWLRDVLVGVHLRPSMHDVHIHVLSRDMHSDRLRHRKHYNSFTTPFFVPLDAFPLAADDPRRTASEAYAYDDDEEKDADNSASAYIQGNMHCWRCGCDFGHRFQELKRHLDVEFAAWRKE